MDEELTPAVPAPAATPSSAVSARLLVFFSGLAVVIAAACVLAGAVIAHEVWTQSPQASAAGGTSGLTPSTNVPSQGGFGFGNPYTGGGSSSAGNQDPFSSGGSSSSASGAPSNADAIAAKVDPALVNINTSLSYQGAEAAGTGIVISSNGEILTNNHVIDGATNITATDVGNGKTYKATVVGYDSSHDVAVLQLQDASGLQTAPLGDSSKVAVGDAVVGIGNAGGTGGTPTSAGGSVIGLNTSLTAEDDLDGGSEQLTGMIEVNADIQAGDSGGPLVDDQGDVIGIDTAGSDSSSGFASYQSSGGAYAIPIDAALSIVKQIESGSGSSTVHIGDTAFLGLTITSASDSPFGGTSTTNGVTVGSVLDGKPAQEAGLAAGDVITSVDGQSVDSQTSLSSLLLTHQPGDKIQLGWTDTSGQSHTSSVSLASGPPA